MTDNSGIGRFVVDVTVQSSYWRRTVPDAGALARKMAAAALRDGLRKTAFRGTLHRKISPRRQLEVSVVLASNAAVRRLNKAYRGQDKPTNVLAFPSDPPPAGPWPLGDVIVAYGVAAAESRAGGGALRAHLVHLVLHGVLHLLGYDHIGAHDAAVMERLESEIMARMGYADPYAAPLPTPEVRPHRTPAARRRLAKSK